MFYATCTSFIEVRGAFVFIIDLVIYFCATLGNIRSATDERKRRIWTTIDENEGTTQQWFQLRKTIYL
jgi:F0F1-type ATP synthase membrane subunit b/b'